MSMIFCRDCGKEIHESAASCPHCGALQKASTNKLGGGLKSQTLAAVLAAFLGSIGIHRFYLGKIISGVLYLVFCWTGIPTIISAIETYLIAFMTPEKWAKKYNNGEMSNPVHFVVKILLLLPGVFLIIAMIGVVAAVALPAYQSYQAKSRVSEAILLMTPCKVSQALAYQEKGSFSKESVYGVCSVSALPKGVAGMGMASGASAIEITTFFAGGPLEGNSVSLFGKAVNGSEISWQCVSGSINGSFLPKSCELISDWKINTFPFQKFEDYKTSPPKVPAAPANVQPPPVAAQEPSPAPAPSPESAPAAVAAPTTPVQAPVAVAPTPVPAPELKVDTSPFAPSFDCAKAGTGPERLICSDRELSKLDVDLSQAYSRAREKSADKNKLKSEQLEWFKRSRNACSDKSCMETAYKQRISDLGK